MSGALTNKFANVDNFFDKIFYSPDGCWYWLGSTTAWGYGQITFNRKHQTTHRFSFILHKGQIKNNLCVLHSCDNPLCVNPAHLRLGTKKENTHDMIAKGRKPIHHGENAGNSKLKDSEVIEMRACYKAGTMSFKELANKFNISSRQVDSIIKRKYWKHI